MKDLREFFLKIIFNEQNLQKGRYYLQKKARKKDLVSFATNLTKNTLLKLKNTIFKKMKVKNPKNSNIKSVAVRHPMQSQKQLIVCYNQILLKDIFFLKNVRNFMKLKL